MPPTRSSERIRRGSATRERRHILIVDDEESLAFFLRQSLLEADPAWQIDVAANGEEAVIRINREAYGLIIADLRMPGLNGLELIQMVRALEPKTKVILMTAYGSSRVEDEAARLKVFRYVTKPFDIDDMKAWAAAALEGWEVVAAQMPAAQTPAAQESRPAPEPARETKAHTQAAVASTSREPQTRANLARPERLQVLSEARAAEKEEARAASVEAQAAALEKLRSSLAQLGSRLGSRHVFLADSEGRVLAEAAGIAQAQYEHALRACAQAMRSLLESQDEGLRATLFRQSRAYDACCVSVGSKWLLVAIHDSGSHVQRLITIMAALQAAALAFEQELSAMDGEALVTPAETVSVRPMRAPEAPPGDESSPAVEEARPGEPGLARQEPSAGLAPDVELAAEKRDPVPAAPSDDPFEDQEEGAFGNPGASDQVFSLDQAKAMGLIDDNLLSKLFGEQPPDS